MKQGKKLLPALIVLCSCISACGKNIPVPVEIYCPQPQKPELPLLSADLYLDSPANIEILMQRDDIMRGYIEGLEDTILCYENSQKERNNEHKRPSCFD